ncbi:MAG: viroplasmin family protein [Clostridium sp.]|uniref:ribonuclease H1 domain-containing protein n=1 Tax=Clostridium sp. TaxID=1506 RepID=UPI00399B9A27
MAKKRFYAIKKGKGNTKNKILETWSECKDLVLGYPAEYKGFATKEEAEIYLGIKNVPNDEIHLRTTVKKMKVKKRRSRNKNTTILEVNLCKELYNEFSVKCSSLDISENDIIVNLIKEWLL